MLKAQQIDAAGSAPAQPRTNVLRDMLALFALWHRRARERSELAHMDQWAQDDLGLSAADIWCESRKACWRP